MIKVAPMQKLQVSGLRRLRDARTEKALIQRLRALPEQRALGTIRRLSKLDPKIAVRIANRVLRRPELFEALFREGLKRSNESTARDWLEGAAQRLGAARVVQLVQVQLQDDPKSAERALYWLPSIAKDDEEAEAELRQLREAFARR